jgi:DNA integrity scanning protein DisA with diadenylate cyclase activity
MTEEEINIISEEAKNIVSKNLLEWSNKFKPLTYEWNTVIDNENISNHYYKVITSEITDLIEKTIFDRLNHQYAEEETLEY